MIPGQFSSARRPIIGKRWRPPSIHIFIQSKSYNTCSISLPSQDVRITAYNQSARQISIEGEANKAALAYEFAEKVKKAP